MSELKAKLVVFCMSALSAVQNLLQQLIYLYQLLVDEEQLKDIL